MDREKDEDLTFLTFENHLSVLNNIYYEIGWFYEAFLDSRI